MIGCQRCQILIKNKMNRRNFISKTTIVAALMPIMIKLPDSVHWEFIKTDTGYIRVYYRGEIVGRISEDFTCLRRCSGTRNDPCFQIWAPNDGDKWIPVVTKSFSTYSECVNWIQEKYTF